MQIFHKRASFDYEIIDKIEVGIVLIGSEVKAIRAGRADITQSHAKIMNGQLTLINANIITNVADNNATKMRRLLAHKKEIDKLEAQIKQKKLTLIPLRMYTKDHRIKLELGLVRSKKEFSKKQIRQQRDVSRDTARELKESTR